MEAVNQARRYGLSVAIFVSLRPRQWVKNVILFFPFVFSINTLWSAQNPSRALFYVGLSFLTFLIFCALSSSVYLINDIADRERDALHPRKSARPIASGALAVPVAIVVLSLLLLVSVAGSFALSAQLAGVCALYLLLNLAYTFYLKSVVIADVLSVAAGYVLRLLAGSVILGVNTSPWLYVTIGLGALLLVLGKRQGEIARAGAGDWSQRPVLADYTPDLLRQLIGVTTTCTLLAYALYLFAAKSLPDNHAMFLTLPLVVYGLFRYIYLVEVRGHGENPETLMLGDRHILASIGLWMVTAVAVLALFRP